MRMWLIFPALSAALRLTMSSLYLSDSPSYESSYWSVMKLYRTLLLFLVGTGPSLSSARCSSSHWPSRSTLCQRAVSRWWLASRLRSKYSCGSVKGRNGR